MNFEKVFLGSGHMIDAPDREKPRFPSEKAEAVRAEISRQFDEWKMSGSDLAICGGACGADILFGEEAMRRGAKVSLLLAETPDEFARHSVEHAGSDWVRRFFALAEKAEVRVLEESSVKNAGDLSMYARVNLWMIETARSAAAERTNLYALLVWDEKSSGDGAGGTADFAARVRDLGGQIAIINPTTIR